MWKQIESLNYEVNEFSEVRNKTTLKIIKPFKGGTSDYLMVRLHLGKSVKRSCLVHRLVAINFIENPENKAQVNHKDGNKVNNHISNLEWNTRKENINHALNIGLSKRYNNQYYKGKTGFNHNKSKAVACIENGMVYGSMAEAERLNGIGNGGVYWSIKHKKKIKGMTFKIFIN